MKLTRVYSTSVGPGHPLFDVLQYVENHTDPLDHKSVENCFSSIEVPTGYFAHIAWNEYGWFIEFYQPMN
jgi:hypothetical protein